MKKQRIFYRTASFCSLIVGLLYGSQIFAGASFNEITASVGISNDDIQSPVGGGGTSGMGIMAGGIAWIDYDNDGFQDLFIPNVSTGPSRLYRNNGPDTGGNYSFSDVSSAANVEVNGAESAGAAVGDYDADGFEDIFVSNINGPNTLLRKKV